MNTLKAPRDFNPGEGRRATEAESAQFDREPCVNEDNLQNGDLVAALYFDSGWFVGRLDEELSFSDEYSHCTCEAAYSLTLIH